MQAHTSVGLRGGRCRRAKFRILVSEHQDGIADPDLRVHHFSVRPETKPHHLGPEGAMIKIGGGLGVVHDDVWGQSVKAFGNGGNGAAHENALSTKFSFDWSRFCRKYRQPS